MRCADLTAKPRSYNLPPTTIATPLPVAKSSKALPTTKASSKPTEENQKRNLKRKRSNKDASTDDTPRAFTRLLAFSKGIKPRSGLDDGIRPSKKQKKKQQNPNPGPDPQPISTQSTIPKIGPGERISDYAARVDALLPVSGLINKGGKGSKNLPGVKERRTKLERKMQKMYAEWREVEERRKEKLEALKEEAENAEADFGTLSKRLAKKGKGKGKRNQDSDDEDPWAVVARNRKSASATNGVGGLVGLHDVVQAPPQFSKPPREKFKVRNGAGVDVADVPGAAGSLRRREELGAARKGVVEGYRAMMKERRIGSGTV